jgi:hypothetical protein
MSSASRSSESFKADPAGLTALVNRLLTSLSRPILHIAR